MISIAEEQDAISRVDKLCRRKGDQANQAHTDNVHVQLQCDNHGRSLDAGLCAEADGAIYHMKAG